MNNNRVKQLTKALKELAHKDTQLSVNELRIIIALERAIARIQHDKELADHLIFKGGFVLLKQYQSHRFTRDADALAVSTSKETFANLVRQAITTDLDDGLWFGDMQVNDLPDQGRYGSLRFDFAFQIGAPKPGKIHKLSRIHIDAGFSNDLAVQATHETMPSLFPTDEPVSWTIYPVEQIVAEKLETLFQRGIENSRAKDVYDLVYLMPRCANRKQLLDSIQHTFANRETPLPASFTESAKQMTDLTILQAAWPGVKITADKPTFAEVWERLMWSLQELDRKRE